MSEVTFVHLSDTHILPADGDRLHGVDTAAQLRKAVKWVRAMPTPPAFCIISGDLADKGDEVSYLRFKELIAPLVAMGLPVLLGLGNHDRRLPFRRVMLDGDQSLDENKPYYYSRTLAGLRILMLDSKVPGIPAGELDAQQLAWLDDELASPAPLGDIVVIHHPPTDHPVAKLEEQEHWVKLRNPEALATVLRGRGILGLLSGHSHTGAVGLWEGLLSATAPATAFLSDPAVSDGWRMYDAIGLNVCTVRDGVLTVCPTVVGGSFDTVWDVRWADIAAAAGLIPVRA